MKHISKIVWAVDVFESPELHENAVQLLKALAGATKARIHPVYVLGAPYAAHDGTSEIEKTHEASVARRLQELADGCGIDGMAERKILINRKWTTGESVRKLIAFAQEQNADLIVAATHARTGLSRLFVGSFAETLALHTTVPVMTVNPHNKPRSSVKKILLPTTFQKRFKDGFVQAAQFAKAAGGELTLYYKEPALPSAFAAPGMTEMLAAEAEARKRVAAEWKSWATLNEVPLTLIIDERPGHPVSAIEEMATRENFDLVVMVSQADPVSAVIIGSTARQVMRQAPCPVWMIRGGGD